MKCIGTLGLGLAIVLTVSAADEKGPDFSREGVAFLKQHCLECHSGEDPKAELSLEGYRDSASVVKGRKTFEKVLRMLAIGEMPPKKKARPTVAAVEAFTERVQAVWDYSDRNSKPDPGRVTMRRLNRVEYRNTVRDLLGVDFDPTESFPSDDIGHGFDNIGDVLTLSPVLMERYLDAAETISKRVISVNPPKPPVRYLSGIYLQPGGSTTKDPFRRMDPASEDAKVSGPLTGPGGYFKLTADAELFLRATLYAEPKGKEPVHVALYIQGGGVKEGSSAQELAKVFGGESPRLKGAKILKTFEITARDSKAPQTIEVKVSRTAVANAGIALVKPASGKPHAILHIRHLSTEGPLETRPSSHLKLLGPTMGQPTAARQQEMIGRLLRRAYRRPPTQVETDRVFQFAAAQMKAGLKWEAAMQKVVQVVLCSPKFLFRVEMDDRPTAPEARPIDEFHLAARLSYFLWSSMPDDALLDLATNRKLTANLDAQVDRMLADARAGELVRNFMQQWLQIQRLQTVAPDTQLFPAFNESLRQAMLRETELFCETVMKEDRSLLELIDADFTFLNAPLAKHYGISKTGGEKPQPLKFKGADFQRVLLADRTRGGLLTQASVLTVTSNPTRTSPVKRGRWVLEQFLGSPPPPPPPDVPELEETGKTLTADTLRKRMEVHRKNPSCANCHAKMDPIGFALENYNAIGGYRTQDGGQPIDAAGEFADGTKFAGVEDLKTIIRHKKALFVRCISEKMLTYALGRGLTYRDRPAIEKIATALERNEYKFSVLVKEIAKSEPFGRRRGFKTED
ncbi:MAG: DUF1592 domain-containing protein [Verrucomicrobia subdivision 3 bacterium]|nr:DUF1592 domain-containing protein [Limisphaerales bacterium]